MPQSMCIGLEVPIHECQRSRKNVCHQNNNKKHETFATFLLRSVYRLVLPITELFVHLYASTMISASKMQPVITHNFHLKKKREKRRRLHSFVPLNVATSTVRLELSAYNLSLFFYELRLVLDPVVTWSETLLPRSVSIYLHFELTVSHGSKPWRNRPNWAMVALRDRRRSRRRARGERYPTRFGI